MDIEKLYDLYTQYYLVDTDTRNIRRNTIFFALKGENFNGNEFAEEALNKGAFYSVVDEKKYKTSSNIILVNNVLETLQKLANYHRNELGIPIIGLTGSNGKTTTKELINAVLSEKFTTVATKGNLNNHIGVPLTLLSMNPKTEIGIIEMGANHLKEINFLTHIATPDFGYITNFGKAHLEGFGSVEGVIKGKSELYDYLIQYDKLIFVNPEDPIQVAKAKRAKYILFDEDIQFLELNPFVKLSFKGIEIQTHLIGKYNFPNIAAAITIGNYFEISPNRIKKAIEGYVPDNNRSQIVQTATNKIVLDAYNANPTSMKAALENFNSLEDANKVIILGDMFEVGNDSLQEHQYIVDFASQLGFNTLIFVGANFAKTTTEHIQCSTFEELQEYLNNHPLRDSFILIKGSRGMSLERALDFID